MIDLRAVRARASSSDVPILCDEVERLLLDLARLEDSLKSKDTCPCSGCAVKRAVSEFYRRSDRESRP